MAHHIDLVHCFKVWKSVEKQKRREDEAALDAAILQASIDRNSLTTTTLTMPTETDANTITLDSCADYPCENLDDAEAMGEEGVCVSAKTISTTDDQHHDHD